MDRDVIRGLISEIEKELERFITELREFLSFLEKELRDDAHT